MTEQEIAIDVMRAFTTAAVEKGYVVMGGSVARSETWTFAPRIKTADGDPALVVMWELKAEVHGTNRFGAKAYRQIHERANKTRQVLALAIATLDTPW